MKTVFMFPGQGAQAVGMGRDLYESDEAIAGIYRRANEIVGYDLAQICFQGPQERLNETEISQPAIFVTSVACCEALRRGLTATALQDVQPDVCAGLSLGEYSALWAAGACDFEAGLRLVQLRGRSMQQAAQQRAGAMVSVLGLDESQSQALCEAALEQMDAEDDGRPPVLAAVNFNCPGQIVLSGTTGACAAAAALAEQHGASRAIPLAVAGAFHTEIMAPAAEALRQALAAADFGPLRHTVVANVDAEPYDGPEQIGDKLMRQLVSPVLWQQSVQGLLDDGCERFVEIGPGRVLTGLVKKIARERRQKVDIITVNGLNA